MFSSPRSRKVPISVDNKKSFGRTAATARPTVWQERSGRRRFFNFRQFLVAVASFCLVVYLVIARVALSTGLFLPVEESYKDGLSHLAASFQHEKKLFLKNRHRGDPPSRTSRKDGSVSQTAGMSSTTSVVKKQNIHSNATTKNSAGLTAKAIKTQKKLPKAAKIKGEAAASNKNKNALSTHKLNKNQKKQVKNLKQNNKKNTLKKNNKLTATLPLPKAPGKKGRGKFGVSRALDDPIPDALKQRLQNMFHRLDLIVVFGDFQYLDLVLNSHASFVKNAPPETAREQYLVVGMDNQIVQACTKMGITSLLYSDILDESNVAVGALLTKPAANSTDNNKYLGRLRCARMEVVLQLQKAGYNILLLDSDIVVANAFDLLSYVSRLDVDFSSGHGTFPLDMYNQHGFALQSGFYYVRANKAGKEMMMVATQMCRQVGNGQITLNQYVMSNFETIEEVGLSSSNTGPKSMDKAGRATHDTDSLGTRMFVARTIDYRGTGEEAELRLAILGKTFFPTGCKFLDTADPNAKVRHPTCIVSPRHMPMDRRTLLKIRSLDEQNAWFLEVPPKKAIFWSYPGSGNTLLRYTYEQITGKVGSTNSVYNDRRLTPVLPGEGSLQGSILKVHPAFYKPPMTDSLTRAIADSKRVIIMRDPFDAIWSLYQLQQTSSHVKHIKQRDFSPNHFALQALQFADKYRNAVEEELSPFSREHPDKVLILKFEELVKNQDAVLRRLLAFVGDEVSTGEAAADLRLLSHPLIQRQPATDEDQSKAAAYGAIEGLVDQMWDIVREPASLYGYSKPDYFQGNGTSSKFLVLPGNPKKLPPIKNHRYLSYTPTGGLTNQLQELESAMQLAQMSGRTLVLPPLLAEAVMVFPDLWTDPNAPRLCNGTIGASLTTCGLSIENTEKFVWSRILNMTQLFSRVSMVEEIPQEVAPLMSKLSLCDFHVCNTRWHLDEDSYDNVGCFPDYTQEFRPQERKVILLRSARCIFETSGGVNVVHFGGIHGAFEDGPVVPNVVFNNLIISAATAISDRIRSDSDDNGKYACVQLRLAGGTWESQSPHIARREEHFQRILDFLSREAIDRKMPLYIATDNEALVRARTDLCGEWKCLFLSDFSGVQARYGLVHFQELIPVDYLVCSGADHVEVSKLSSFGWFINNLHEQRIQRLGQ